MIRSRGESRPKNPRPDAGVLRSLSGYEFMMVNSDYLTLRLTPNGSINVKRTDLGTEETLVVSASDMVACRNRVLVTSLGLTGFEFGAFVHTEYKKNRFAAAALVSQAAAPAEWFKSRSTLECFEDATAEETLCAQALLTYEFWLRTSAVSETVVKLPFMSGSIYRFCFGRELNVMIAPPTPLRSEN